MEAMHTEGPLFVRQPESFPFRIETVNANGDVVFSEMRWAFSTKHKSVEDVMSCAGMYSQGDARLEECIKMNERQVADAYLRAAAPELLALAELFAQTVDYYIRCDERSDDQEGANLKRVTLSRIQKVIAKSRGEA